MRLVDLTYSVSSSKAKYRINLTEYKVYTDTDFLQFCDR